MAKGLILCVLIASFIAVALCSPVEQFQTIMGVRIYDLDPTCAMLGGLCVKTSDCLEQPTKSGLCPTNLHIGVDCCYELAVKEGSCRSFGGECMPVQCPKNLRKPSTDCSSGENCCVLI